MPLPPQRSRHSARIGSVEPVPGTVLAIAAEIVRPVASGTISQASLLHARGVGVKYTKAVVAALFVGGSAPVPAVQPPDEKTWLTLRQGVTTVELDQVRA